MRTMAPDLSSGTGGRSENAQEEGAETGEAKMSTSYAGVGGLSGGVVEVQVVGVQVGEAVAVDLDEVEVVSWSK